MKPADRRHAYRHLIQVPVVVYIYRTCGPQESAESVNLSEEGVYFITQYPRRIGTAVQLTLQMPEEITGVISKDWKCMGHIVHTEALVSKPGALGVGVRFDYYEVIGIEYNSPELNLSLLPG